MQYNVSDGNAKRYSTLENSSAVSSEVTHTLIKGPAITVLGIYPIELETPAHTNTGTQMFISRLIRNSQKLQRSQTSSNR